MENEKFVCKDLMVAAYFMTHQHDNPELEIRDGKVAFLFNKDNDLMHTYHQLKEDAFFKTLKDNYHSLKRSMYQFRQGKN